MYQEWYLEGKFTIGIAVNSLTRQTYCQININSWGRDPYAKRLAEALQTRPFPDAVEDAVKVFEDVCERFFHLFGSAGKA